jgi:hypothetical protein
MSKDKSVKEAEILLDSLEREPVYVEDIDPLKDLRKSLITFLKDSIGYITDQEGAKKTVLNSILKLVAESTLTFDQLAKLYSILSSEKNANTSTILALFMPQGKDGNISPIASSLTKEDDENPELGEQKLTAVQRETLEYLSRIVGAYDAANRKKEEQDLKDYEESQKD